MQLVLKGRECLEKVRVRDKKDKSSSVSAWCKRGGGGKGKFWPRQVLQRNRRRLFMHPRHEETKKEEGGPFRNNNTSSLFMEERENVKSGKGPSSAL